MEDTDDKKGLVILGRDVNKVPCFRNSFLQGIGGGFGVGLSYFLFSSNTKKSAHIGFLSYVGLTLVAWSYCRWSYARKEAEQKLFKQAVQQKILYEGTDIEKQIEAQTKEV